MGYLHDLNLFTRLFGIGIILSMIQLRKWNLRLLDSSQFHNQWTQKPGLGLWIYTCRSTKPGYSPLSWLGLEYHSITDRNQVVLVKSPCEVVMELTKMRTRMVSLQQVNKPICRWKMAALYFVGYSSNIVTDRLSTITLSLEQSYLKQRHRVHAVFLSLGKEWTTFIWIEFSTFLFTNSPLKDREEIKGI